MESKYTTKVKVYRTSKQVFLFDKPIVTGASPSLDTIAKRVEARKAFDVSSEESILRSVNRNRVQIYDLAVMNDWDWFVTFTFNPALVDSYNYEETARRLSKWLNNIRRNNPDMKYVIVPETHASGRYHFHGLVSDVSESQFIDSEKRDTKGRVIYNWGKYSLGWSTATKIGSNEHAVKYLTKYITKESMQVTKNKKKYWSSRNLILPQVHILDLDKQQQSDYKNYEKEKTTSAKVIQIENDSYVNTVEIVHIDL